jgi:hypothetical protein
MTDDKNTCPDNHRQLQFGSGDYYIFCHSCHRKWMLHGDAMSIQPEYYFEYYFVGNQLIYGADPSKQTYFVGDPLRTRKDET